MKTLGVSRLSLPGMLTLLAMVLAPLAASAQQPRVREPVQECRCSDANGQPVGNCVCFRTNGGTGTMEPLLFAAPARARIGVSLEEATNGARVAEVRPGSPAANAGIMAGDIITRIGDQVLTAPLPPGPRERTAAAADDPAVQRLMTLAQRWEPGQAVQVEYLRGSDRRTVTVTTEEVPPEERAMTLGNGGRVLFNPLPRERLDGMLDSVRTFRFRADSIASRFPGIVMRADSLVRDGSRQFFSIGRGCGGVMVLGGLGDSSCVDGVRMVELNAGLGEYFGTTRGVLVTDTPENASLGLRAGDVILSIGGRAVADPAAAVRMLSSYERDEEVPLRVMRKNQEVEVRGRRQP